MEPIIKKPCRHKLLGERVLEIQIFTKSLGLFNCEVDLQIFKYTDR